MTIPDLAATTAHPLVRDDAAKLRTLADWFDARDRQTGSTDDEVQRDLRRIAREVERLTAHIAAVGGMLRTAIDLAERSDEPDRVPTRVVRTIEQLNGAALTPNAIERVRELHRAEPNGIHPPDVCDHCRLDWPCPTIRALGDES